MGRSTSRSPVRFDLETSMVWGDVDDGLGSYIYDHVISHTFPSRLHVLLR